MTSKYPGLPLEQRIGALRNGDVTHHGEPVGSVPLTVQPPRRLAVADDIVKWIDLASACLDTHICHDCERSVGNSNPLAGSVCRCGCHQFPWEDAAAEIERLHAALALAVGELSTHGQYAVYSPDQLMQQFLEEARRG